MATIGRSDNIHRRRVGINPLELFRRLAECLGFPVLDTGEKIVTQDFPDVNLPLEEFRDRYLLKEILRKYPNFDLGIDTNRVALDSFKEAERVNRETNERLSSSKLGHDPRVIEAYSLSCRKASEIAGRLNVRGFIRGARFGPGATTGTKAAQAAVPLKLSKVLDVTREAHDLAYLYLTTAAPKWAYGIVGFGQAGIEASTVLRIVDGDRAALVPKSALTGRLIFVQPCANAVLQLGAGRALRERMFSYGINLQDQEINQRRARQASLDGKNATVDIKDASNSLTKLVVWDHFGNHSISDGPHSRSDPRWFILFDKLRTRFGVVDGKPHEFEMFSAMGNGYTFEVESLIFYCLASATCEVLGIEPDVSVYGDDIICPSAAVKLLTDVLSHAGFSLNEKKTFVSTEGSLFRESCGAHYLNGFDVTPFYVDKPLDTYHEIMLLANNLRRWASHGSWGCDVRVLPLYEWIVSHLPNRVQRTCIPLGVGDNGLVKSFDEARPSLARRKGVPGSPGSPCHRANLIYGYNARVLVRHSHTKVVDGEYGLLAWLYSREVSKFQPKSWLGQRLQHLFPKRVKPFGIETKRYTLSFRTQVVRDWPDIGPWIEHNACSTDSCIMEQENVEV